MKIEFTQEELANLDKILSKYPAKEAALMPVLWFAQEKFGYISDEIILWISDYLCISPSKIQGVVSFYTMFHRFPIGKYHIQICTNVSCMLKHGFKYFQYVSDKYNIKNMEVTSNGMFSLEEVECMGACGSAPMIAINENYYENMSIEKLEELLSSLT